MSVGKDRLAEPDMMEMERSGSQSQGSEWYQVSLTSFGMLDGTSRGADADAATSLESWLQQQFRILAAVLKMRAA